MNLPLEIIAEILSWLPVDAILRLRCVCKTWYSFIKQPQFIKLHLLHSVRTLNPNHGMLIFEQSRYENGILCLTPFDDDAISGFPLRVHLPFREDRVRMCHCDGLVLVTKAWANECVLWNPILRKQKMLTLPGFECRGFPGSVVLVDFGFGFDLESGDHKIVRLVLYADWYIYDYCKHNIWTSEVKVYSFRKNSWTKVPDLPFNDLKLCTPSVHANGALHWLVCDRDSSERVKFVIAFDLANEGYHKLLVPFNVERVSLSCLTVLDGRLCMCLNDNAKARQEVWLMKEYGVNESWCRLFIFENCALPCKPLVFSKTSVKVLMEKESKELFWYDRISGEIEEVKISVMPLGFKTMVCARSLLLLDGDGVQDAQL
ncbi:F-box protein CPR1-like [Gastrolobium bilobum]|uniref:F-box protein CPR1-like n=1 Tax=Gastrolobium bilobum TaxID=150636 RepID=UPI002AB2EAFB|nr:F-box protein CPR1-like [Gastrolobium bilobum]